jgi:hypothetical protein
MTRELGKASRLSFDGRSLFQGELIVMLIIGVFAPSHVYLVLGGEVSGK